jgi:hypothetical protein
MRLPAVASLDFTRSRFPLEFMLRAKSLQAFARQHDRIGG